MNTVCRWCLSHWIVWCVENCWRFDLHVGICFLLCLYCAELKWHIFLLFVVVNVELVLHYNERVFVKCLLPRPQFIKLINDNWVVLDCNDAVSVSITLYCLLSSMKSRLVFMIRFVHCCSITDSVTIAQLTQFSKNYAISEILC